MTRFLPNLFSDPNVLRDPFASLRRQVDDLASSFAHEWPLSTFVGAAAPAINVAETDKAVQIAAELPGVDEKDIKVEVEGQRIIISGEKKREREEKDQNWHVVERSFGSFRRAVTLPFEPKGEGISARYDKGVLYIDIPKPQSVKSAAKTIEIKTGAPVGPKAAPEGKAA
jgi:HSP20 family protein